MRGVLMDTSNEWTELGKYIRKVRTEKGISAYSIEKNYEFSRQFWSRIELGTQKSAMKPDLLKKIASILGINYINLYLIVGYIDKESLDEYIKETFKKEENA